MASSSSTFLNEKWEKFKAQCDALLAEKDKMNATIFARKARVLLADLIAFKTVSDDPNFKVEYIKYDALLSGKPLADQLKDKVIETLKEKVSLYLADQFHKKGLKIKEKPLYTKKQSGVQVGQIVTIQTERLPQAGLPDIKDDHSVEETQRFFIKTHQHGSSKDDPRAQNIDPKELLIYKILEHSQLGEKAHFIPLSDEPGQLVIMTEDAASSKPGSKYVNFSRYESDLLEHKDQPPISLSLEVGLIKIDLITKLLHLTDAISNSDNFGVVINNEKISKFTLIDFRTVSADYEGEQNIITKFTQDFGQSAHPNIKHHALEEDPLKKIILSKNILSDFGKEPSLAQSVEKALKEVSAFITNNYRTMNIPLEKMDETLAGLKRFCKGVIDNTKVLQKQTVHLFANEIKLVRETGKKQYDEGQFLQALETYQKFLKFAEWNVQTNGDENSIKNLTSTLYNIGSCELKLNNFEKAIETLEKAVKLNTDKFVTDNTSTHKYQLKINLCRSKITEIAEHAATVQQSSPRFGPK